MGAETIERQMNRLRSQLVLTRSQLQEPYSESERQILLRRMDALLDRFGELMRQAEASLPS